MNGGNGKVVFIDTEGELKRSRCHFITSRRIQARSVLIVLWRLLIDMVRAVLYLLADKLCTGVDANAVLENITYARAFTSDHQLDLLMRELPSCPRICRFMLACSGCCQNGGGALQPDRERNAYPLLLPC